MLTEKVIENSSRCKSYIPTLQIPDNSAVSRRILGKRKLLRLQTIVFKMVLVNVSIWLSHKSFFITLSHLSCSRMFSGGSLRNSTNCFCIRKKFSPPLRSFPLKRVNSAINCNSVVGFLNHFLWIWRNLKRRCSASKHNNNISLGTRNSLK